MDVYYTSNFDVSTPEYGASTLNGVGSYMTAPPPTPAHCSPTYSTSQYLLKKQKKMEYDRHILNSTNSMKTSWNLINIELGKGTKNQIIVTKYWW